MDAQTFLGNFGSIAEAPGGVERLRELVLDLAIRGHLVPYNDEDAPELLHEAVDLKRRLREGPSAQRMREFRRGSLDGLCYPTHWVTAHLGDVCFVAMGNSPPGDSYNDSGEGVPLVNGPVEFSSGPLGATLKTKYTTQPTQMCSAGDLLVCVRGATTGRTNVAAFDACVGRGVALVRAWRSQPFVNLFMWRVGKKLLALGKGTTFPSISYDDLAGLAIGLPSISEQTRIVAKVNELLQLCDDLEARQKLRRDIAVRARGACLRALATAETDDDIRSAWFRVHANWVAITESPGSASALRQAVLQLAVGGKLVPQDPREGSGHALAEQIALMKSGRDARADIAATTTDRLHPIPQGWAWVQLGALIDRIEAGKSPTAQPRPKVGDEWGVLKVSACSWGRFRPEENKALLPGTTPDARFEVRPGDFLISRANTQELVARSVVVGDSPRRLLISDKTLRLTPSMGCDPEYLNLANLASAARSHYERNASGTSDSMRNVSQDVIRSTPIPLPPTAEQLRVVRRYRALIELCDDLERALERTLQASRCLAGAATAGLSSMLAELVDR